MPSAIVELRGQRVDVGDGTEVGIEDPVAFVGDERRGVATAHHNSCAERFEVGALDRTRELQHLYRQRHLRTERGRRLRVVDDDHLAPTRLSDHLLAQERATVALDQIQRGIDFIGAVDGEVDDRVLDQRDEWDPDLRRVVCTHVGGGDADDVAQAAVAQRRTDGPDRPDRGGPGAETHDHARLHPLHRTFGRRALLLGSRILGSQEAGFSSWPPNSLRIADSTRFAKSDSPREVKRS